MNRRVYHVVEVRRGVACRGNTSWGTMSWVYVVGILTMSWRFEACRGCRGCRGEHGGMSWGTSMSWMYVVGTSGMSWDTQKHVVEQSFPGGCRGDEGSMSWVIGMSWRHVVEHTVVVEVCRG